MKKYSLIFLLLTTCLFSLQAQDKVVPKELRPFIREGYELMDFLKTDLNGDNRPDYILILKIKGEDTIGFDNTNWDASRPLLLIVRQPDNSLKNVISNSELVLCKQCGGVMGDPYQGVTGKPGGFTIDFYGGSSWRWSETYSFSYDKIKKNWFLQRHTSSNFQSGDPEKTEENTTINRNEIGDIILANFSPYYNSDSSIWKVKTAKTYFYSSPILGSTPKKAWLVKGNTVTSVKLFKNFIQCSFTNSGDKITEGFLLKKDLLLVESNKPKAL